MAALGFRLKRKLLKLAVAPVIGRRRAWSWLAQRAELHFHQNNQWRQTADFYRQTQALFAHFGFAPDAFDGKTLIDLGAGSRLRTTYFRNAKLVVIEPLADEFRRTIPWCDLATAARVFSTAAEERIPELWGEADGVVSINVLDHCYDLAPILGNLGGYLKQGGVAFLSFDAHDDTDLLHPLRLGDRSVEGSLAGTGLVVEQRTTGLGPLGPNYGQGRAVNYWLRRTA